MNRVIPALLQTCLGALIASIIPFISKYLLDDGYELYQVGLILAFANILAFFSSSLFTLMKPKYVMIYILLIVISILSYLAYNYTDQKILWICFYFTFFTPAIAFLDKYTIDHTGIIYYPIYRSTASLFWGITAAIISYFIDYPLVPIFIYIGFSILSFIVGIIHENKYSNVDNTINNQESIVLESLSMIKIICFILLTFCYSIAMNIIGYYFIIYIDSVFDGNNFITSMRQLLSVSLEIPSFIFYPKLLNYVKNKYILYLSVIFIIIQLMGYLVTTNAKILLIFEILHGVSFALFWSSSFNIIYNNQEKKETIHFVFWSIFQGLGVFAALILGGYIPLIPLFIFTIIVNSFSLLLFMFINKD